MRVWSDEDATSTNPICLDDVEEEDLYEAGMTAKEAKEAKKKKRRRRRKKAADEESSVADSMVSSILSDIEDIDEAVIKEAAKFVPQTIFHETRELERKQRRFKLEELKNRRNSPKKQLSPKRASLYPSSDEESNNEADDLSKNPFVEDDLSLNPFSDKNNAKIADDDLSKNPFVSKNAPNSSNPFGDDSIRDRASFSASEESSTLRPPPLSMYLEESKKGNNPFEQDDDEESDDEDIVESSKRLLRCVDQRIQYQQQNDEVHSLKEQMRQMRSQAETMAEQLRRAVETKCDLILAQNEMERLHEQSQIVKEAEVRDLRLYIQEILDSQAKSELNFMNEIASLAGMLENIKTKHGKELAQKESKIQQLEDRIEVMRLSSVREISSESFHKRNGMVTYE